MEDGSETRAVLREPGDIMTMDEMPAYVTAIMGPDGGRMAYNPRGCTVARLVYWPTLSEVEQGDGTKQSNEVIASGYAVCASMDNYVRETGRHWALRHLLDTALDSKILSPRAVGAVAQCYANRHGKVRKVKPPKAKVPKVIEHLDPGDETQA